MIFKTNCETRLWQLLIGQRGLKARGVILHVPTSPLAIQLPSLYPHRLLWWKRSTSKFSPYLLTLLGAMSAQEVMFTPISLLVGPFFLVFRACPTAGNHGKHSRQHLPSPCFSRHATDKDEGHGHLQAHAERGIESIRAQRRIRR